MKYNKYKNKKITVDGIKFDSIREANRYIELKWLEKLDRISNLELQPEFILQEKYKFGGSTIRAIKYRADFKYSKGGIEIIEDVKGMKTDVYKIKKKLLLKRYPEINFRET